MAETNAAWLLGEAEMEARGMRIREKAQGRRMWRADNVAVRMWRAAEMKRISGGDDDVEDKS